LDGHDPYAALRHPGYRLLLCGAVLASVGGEIQAVAVGWELWQRTHNEASLGLTGLAQFLPVLLLALPAGHVADRFSRKYIFLAAVTVSAIASQGLAVLALLWEQRGIDLVYLMYPCLILAGIARAFSAPARSALLTQVVPLESIANAVTWNSSGWQIANVGGPALGGLLIALTGRASPAYLFTSLCLCVCAALLAFVRPRDVPRPAASRSLSSLLDGVRFVWGTKPLLAAITLDLFAVLLGGATALLPVFADEGMLNVGAFGLGCLRAAPALGALLMAVLLAHRPPRKRPGRALLLAVTGFGAATIVFGLSRDFTLSFVMLAVTGALDNVSVVVRGTLMQTLTPDEMRGRVAAVTTVFISSSNELGAAESGYTAKWFGPIPSVVGGGIGTILVVLVVIWRWPLLLRVGPLHPPLLGRSDKSDRPTDEKTPTV
jgi:MFS family permease